MTGIVTKRFRSHNAEQFYESVSEAAPNRLYMFIGRQFPWANDSSPPSETDSVQTIEYDPYRDTLVYKRVQTSDVSYVANKNSWSSGTVYTEYTDTNTTLSSNTFYVVTDDRNVYKCIDNNRSGTSTVKPTGTSSSIITTSDKYRWKYLFTISTDDNNKFTTSSYIPVKKLTANDASAQWSVQQAAANGAIHHIRITANGSGYLSTNGTFAAITNSSVVRLASTANTTDSIYVDSSIFISSGSGATQLRRITNYVGSTRTATVNTAFTTTPNTSSTYIVSPTVIIKGDSGQSSSTRATAYVSNTFGGQVRTISMINEGLNYSTANVTIYEKTGFGSGAAASAIISPPGGHGSNAVDELYAYNVMVTTTFSLVEDSSYPSNNDFRTIGLIRDPRLRSDGTVANTSIIDGSTKLTINGVSGEFQADEIVSGSINGTKAKVIFFANTNTIRSRGDLRVNRVTTTGTGLPFKVTEEITGATSGARATITAVTRSPIREYTGDVLYIDYASPTARAVDQSETVKLIIKY